MMRRILALAGLSAALTALSFAPYNLYVVGFISITPIFYIFENFSLSKKQVLWIWLVWTLVLNLVAYHWIMHTIAVYGMMPAFIAFPLFLLYALGTGGKMLFFFYFLRFLRQKQSFFSSIPLNALAITAAFALCEVFGWQLFPWYGGNIVAGDLYFAQAADLIGTRGLSLVWIALQFLAYTAGKDFFRVANSWRRLFVESQSLQIFIALLVIFHVYGAVQYARFSAYESKSHKLLVGVPQGNVPLITSYGERPYIIARMVAQTKKLVADARAANTPLDLVVWPESSIPAMEYARSSELQNAILSLQSETQTPLIINDIYHETHTGKDYSNMWYLDAEGKMRASYQKNFLLPFGEFMPLGETFPSLKKLFPAVSDFSPGKNFTLFEIATAHGPVRAMPLVCYEVILPDYARAFDKSTLHKAPFIINITNDAWFGDSYESAQHMALGTMRSIELRTPIVRATNSGITALISSTGFVTGETKLFERTNRVYAVPIMERTTTLFALWGNLPVWIFILLVCGLFLLKRWRVR